MANPWKMLCGVLFMLLAGCGNSGGSDELVELVFDRVSFQDRVFEGLVGGQAVHATFSLRQQALSGSISFEQTAVVRAVKGHVSAEGFLRADVLAGGGGADSLAFGGPKSGEIRAVLLTQNAIVGAYQSVLGNSPESLSLSTDVDSLVLPLSTPHSDTIAWSLWRRSVHCIRNSGDTSATISIEVPRLAAGPSRSIVDQIRSQAVLDLVFQRECSCQFLLQENVRLLERRFRLIGNTAEGTTVEIRESKDGRPGPGMKRNFRYPKGAGPAEMDAAVPNP